MKKITTIITLTICLSNVVIGCTCYLAESFNLEYYDESINIAEIKIIAKLKDNYEARLAQYKIDTMNWDKEYPPPPILPPNNYSEFRIEVIEVFKGNLNKSINKLRADEKNSSCYWEPEVGKSYIFYLGEILLIKGDEIGEIQGCQRRIRNDNKNYKLEIEALKILKEKIEGKFKINQSELASDFDKPYISVSGRFKNGNRHGKWIIAEPIINSKGETPPEKKVLILRYRNGNLISVKYFEPYNNFVANYFTRNWKHYYEEKKL